MSGAGGRPLLNGDSTLEIEEPPAEAVSRSLTGSLTQQQVKTGSIHSNNPAPGYPVTVRVSTASVSSVSSVPHGLVPTEHLAEGRATQLGSHVEVPPPHSFHKEGSSIASEADLAGLTFEEHQQLLNEYGLNEIPEHDTPWYILLGKQFIGLMPFMLELATIVSIIAEDMISMAIILTMLLLNGFIGFYEEMKAKSSLDALKGSMTAMVVVKRRETAESEGKVTSELVKELVPGDIIFLKGGNIVPADSKWLEGDEMQVDTAALTGEPLPRKIGGPAHNSRHLLGGCIIRQGEGYCKVEKTGLETEIGQAAGLVQEASGHQAGVFETKTMQVVQAVILIALLDAVVLLCVQAFVRHNNGQSFRQTLLAVLAVLIGAVPIALPLVMQVTMAIGAGTMAKKKAIVTHLTALQEIASMTVLCSDKTGTLTTAKMEVLPQKIWTRDDISKDEALLLAGVASNTANIEDPIDNAVLRACYSHFGSQQMAEARMNEFNRNRIVGFNPITKRTIAYCNHPSRGELKIAKGLSKKILQTGDDGAAEEDCWEVVDFATVKEEVDEADLSLSRNGYKTLGVAIAEPRRSQMRYKAVVPMIDPPREDTAVTIYRVRQGGIEVKMITGDHLNVAVETSRLIGLGTGILPNTDLWPASAVRDATILNADGFAQVLPRDKREVILVLQHSGKVVGMTGDGVNDAPALAQAQIGIAVDGATEAARSAADIILTLPGLSAIFDAVVESRKIFARLRAYVVYRMGATIQIVIVLSTLIFGYNVTMKPFYVILLALLNDLSMIPISSDNAKAAATPEIPSMPQILLAAVTYGAMLTIMSLGFFVAIKESDVLDLIDRSNNEHHCDPGTPCNYIQTCLYLQVSIAIEFVILSCRCPGFILDPQYICGEGRPSLLLLAGILSANCLVSVLAGFGIPSGENGFTKVLWRDIGIIWMYDIVGLIIIDAIKVILGFCNLPIMSAGAAGGTLEYPDLPRAGSIHAGSILSGAARSMTRSVGHANNASVRSQATVAPSVNASMNASIRSNRSQSMLPFPYNLRAEHARNQNPGQ